MSPAIHSPSTRPIVYPDTDGLPMAENTLQFQVIVIIKENLEIQFEHDPMVFVAGDLFWYPEEGNNRKRTAPDVMVVFGVPKGHRGSYLQWAEDGIAPQVVFEILSPGNKHAEMSEKFRTYDRQGVEEYYIYDPETGLWNGWIRQNGELESVPTMHRWTSPRLQICFESVEGTELTLFGRDGQRFKSMSEINAEKRKAEERAELDRLAREQANRRADEATRRANEAEERNAKLLALLKAAGIDAP